MNEDIISGKKIAFHTIHLNKVGRPLSTVTRCLPFQYILYWGVRVGAIFTQEKLHFILDTYLIMLSIEQGIIKYHFFNLWYNTTWNWTLISRAIS